MTLSTNDTYIYTSHQISKNVKIDSKCVGNKRVVETIRENVIDSNRIGCDTNADILYRNIQMIICYLLIIIETKFI